MDHNLYSQRSKVILYFLLLIILYGCAKKEVAAIIEKPKEKDLEILWKTPIVSDTVNYAALGMNPCLYDSLVVFGTDLNYLGEGAPILFMNKFTGALIDTWSEYVEGPWHYTGLQAQPLGDFLILSSITSIDCVNLQTRQTQWSERFLAVGPEAYLDEGYLYTGVAYNGWRNAAIIRTKPDIEQWDTVYSMAITDGYKPHFDAINFGELTNGDKVVVWKNRSYKWSRSRTEVFAYNLTADSLLWKNSDFKVNAGASRLEVDDLRVYGMVKDTLFALDLMDGKLAWKTSFRGMVSELESANMDAGLFWQLGDSLVLKGDPEQLLYIKKNTGYKSHSTELAWGNYGSGVEEFEGNYYITTYDGLYIVDAKSGEVLFTTTGDDRWVFKEIRSRVTIDPETRRMYFHNSRFAICARIPEWL